MTIALVHLVSGDPSGDDFRRFLESYDAHPAEIEHDLVILANAWSGTVPAEVRNRIDGRGLHVVDLPEISFDLDAYRAVAERLSADHLCFANSFSTVLARGWLRMLFAALSEPNVGIAGASGSWESHYTDYLGGAASAAADRPSPVRMVRGAFRLAQLRRRYDAFPNPHVRSNGFMVRRETLLALRIPKLRTKDDAERLESGREGLTRQVEAKGLAGVVVGRDGKAYPKDRFRDSHTFRIGEQCNLLVADNRTRQYAAAQSGERSRLRRSAWGDPADYRCPRCEAG